MAIYKLLLFLLASSVYVGNSVCADCHRNLARRFQATTMARTVTCETCHGPGSMHAKGSARMVVPSALAPRERDSVCAQCHLRGVVQIPRAGKSRKQYRPGDDFARYVATFVSDPPAEAASHVESLAASRCRQQAPGLWCGSCHEVHDGTLVPNACAQCHGEANKPCNNGPDCAACHMPKLDGPVRTDHSIPRRPRSPERAPGAPRLRPFSAADEGARELRLAQESLQRKNP